MPGAVPRTQLPIAPFGEDIFFMYIYTHTQIA